MKPYIKLLLTLKMNAYKTRQKNSTNTNVNFNHLDDYFTMSHSYSIMFHDHKANCDNGKSWHLNVNANSFYYCNDRVHCSGILLNCKTKMSRSVSEVKGFATQI